MKCCINFVQKIDFSEVSQNGVTSCLYIKACKYVKTTADSGINESEFDINIGTDFLNSGFNTIFNKVLFFDSTEIEKAYINQFSKLFDLETGEKVTSKNVFINLERINVPIGAEFYQRYSSDADNHKKGEFIKNNDGEKRVFDSIFVIVVCGSDDIPKEDAKKLAFRNWDANLASREDFTKLFVPVELYEILKEEKMAKDAAVRAQSQSEVF